MPVQPGQMFSQCRLVEQIGAGGMGVVWKALDTSLNRYVAIKILPASLTSDEEWRQRFQREAEAAAALDHPNIAVIHQVGEQDGQPFIVMQLLEGQTLRQMTREGPMPAKRWLRIATGMAEGLAHAHEQGIIHRDLKPDNVMITTDRQVKLLDFGLAKVVESSDPDLAPRRQPDTSETWDSHLTRLGQTFGTLSYMSPEQARGEPTDQRSDIFSLGILLYEMATSGLPFRGQSEQETVDAITSQEPPPLGDGACELPSEAERIIRKALEKEPERRYQHAVDLATDLRNLQRDLTSGRMQAYSGARPATAPADAHRPVRRVWALAGLLLVVVAAAVGYLVLRPGADPGPASTAPAGEQRKMIVVLPFENLGPAEDAYFAAGITEEITSRLAAVEGLGVISRKSASQYADTGKSIKEIGEELGVGYVLEGTVRWARGPDDTSRVRITPQLIRVADDTHLWSEAYDEVIDDIFQVQSQIATRVIENTGVALLETQRQALEFEPTRNMDAYRAYMRGMESSRNPDQTLENFQFQVAQFARAVELDPGYARAYVALSRAHAGAYHFGLDRTEQRQALSLAAVERALELAPDQPESHLALGIHRYWCHKDYEEALEAFAIARQGMPSSAEILEFTGYIRRRQGRWDEAVTDLEASHALNPRDSWLAEELGLTHSYLRSYDRSLYFLDLSISLRPDQANSYLDKAEILWRRDGDAAGARQTLEAMPETDQPLAVMHWFLQEIFEGRYADATRRVAARPEVVLRHYRFIRPRALFLAQAHALAGEPERARRAFQAARQTLERELASNPGDYRVHSALGLALAGLGLKDEAVAEGQRAVEAYPLSRDALFGVFPITDLALIYTMVGEHDAALDRIEHLLSIPSLMSVRLLELDPRYAPLRSHPRFVEMAARF